MPALFVRNDGTGSDLAEASVMICTAAAAANSYAPMSKRRICRPCFARLVLDILPELRCCPEVRSDSGRFPRSPPVRPKAGENPDSRHLQILAMVPITNVDPPVTDPPKGDSNEFRHPDFAQLFASDSDARLGEHREICAGSCRVKDIVSRVAGSRRSSKAERSRCCRSVWRRSCCCKNTACLFDIRSSCRCRRRNASSDCSRRRV